jgi:4-aminobutyrate aminotransferase/(S)-3-amino-2-methylpropionate transaminase
MMLAEFVRDRDPRAPATAEQTLQIVRQAAAGGVIVIRAGLYSNCIRLLPPLVMPEDMLREGLGVVGRAIEFASVRHSGAPAS